MEKPYINQRELTEILGQGRVYGERVMKHLLEIAKEKNYYLPESGRDILIPTHLVKKELKIKELSLSERKWKQMKRKLRLKTKWKIVAFYLIVAIVTFLATVRIESLEMIGG